MHREYHSETTAKAQASEGQQDHLHDVTGRIDSKVRLFHETGTLEQGHGPVRGSVGDTGSSAAMRPWDLLKADLHEIILVLDRSERRSYAVRHYGADTGSRR